MTTEQQRFLDFLGRAAGAAGRGALGAGRFVRDEAVEPITDPFQRFLAQLQGAQYNLDPTQQATLNTLNQELLALDALSKTSAGATTESILAPVLGAQRYGLEPNSFDSFLANLEQQRAQQDLLGALSLQANRDAFRQTQFAPGVAPLIEAGSDVTNLIPGAVFARGLGLGSRTAARAAGALPESVVTTGSRPIVTAAQRGEATAARSAARQAANARPVVPFGPNRTVDGIPAGLPAGAADEVPPVTPDDVPIRQAQGETPAAVPEPDPQDLRAAQGEISARLRAAEADASEETFQTLTRERLAETQRIRFQTNEAVKRLAAQLEQAQPLRPDQVEALRSTERSRRVGRLAGELERGQGTEAFARGVSQLGGELPNPAFQAPVMTADDVFLMTERIRTLPNTRPLTKVNTQNALRHLLEGEVPTTSELILLEKAFGRELVESFLRRPRGVRGAATLITDLLGLPKTIRSAFDLSAPLRQGLLLGPRNPREFISALRDMFRSFDRTRAFAINREIFDDPDVQSLVDKGLFLHNVEQAGPAALTGREEAFISRYAARIPGIGLSERTYGTFLNKLRADVAKKTLNHWRKQGVVIDDARLSALSDFINIFTGRGNLGKFENIGNTLNAAFWSPRLLVSRFQAPAQLANPLVRRQAAENLVATFALGTTILAIVEASRPGRQVETDPRSTDFGKIRIGSTRVDFWGGFQQIARYMAQIATNQTKNPDTGEVYTPRQTNRFDRIGRFGRSKLSPGVATLLANELFSESFLGEDLGERPVRGALPDRPVPIRTGAEAVDLETTREQEAIQQLAPLFALEVVNSMEENGVIGGTLFSFPALFGVGVQSYNDEEAPAGTPQNRTGVTVVPER